MICCGFDRVTLIKQGYRVRDAGAEGLGFLLGELRLPLEDLRISVGQSQGVERILERAAAIGAEAIHLVDHGALLAVSEVAGVKGGHSVV